MVNKTYAIDRIEDGIALCECLHSSVHITVDVKSLPPDAKEGDIILQNGNSFALDQAQTAKRHKNLTDRMNKLFEKHSGNV